MMKGNYIAAILLIICIGVTVQQNPPSTSSACSTVNNPILKIISNYDRRAVLETPVSVPQGSQCQEVWSTWSNNDLTCCDSSRLGSVLEDLGRKQRCLVLRLKWRYGKLWLTFMSVWKAFNDVQKLKVQLDTLYLRYPNMAQILPDKYRNMQELSSLKGLVLEWRSNFGLFNSECNNCYQDLHNYRKRILCAGCSSNFAQFIDPVTKNVKLSAAVCRAIFGRCVNVWKLVLHTRLIRRVIKALDRSCLSRPDTEFRYLQKFNTSKYQLLFDQRLLSLKTCSSSDPSSCPQQDLFRLCKIALGLEDCNEQNGCDYDICKTNEVLVNFECKTCHVSCTKCQGSPNNCLECVAGRILLNDGTCALPNQCKPDQDLVGSTCLCKNRNMIVDNVSKLCRCPDGLVLGLNGVCGPIPPPCPSLDQYLENGICQCNLPDRVILPGTIVCQPCPSGQETYQGPSGRACRCPSGQELYENECVASCGANQTRGPSGCRCNNPDHIIDSNGQCGPCPALGQQTYENTVLSIRTCECVSGFSVYNNECLPNCDADQTRGPSGCTCTGPGKVLYEGACYDPCPADQTRGPSGCTCTGPGKVLYEGACYDPCPADQTRGPSGCTCTGPGKVLYEGACYDPCPADQTRGPSGCTCTVPGKVLYEGACYDPCPADQTRGPSGCTCTVPGKVLYEGACYDPCPADQTRGPSGCTCTVPGKVLYEGACYDPCPADQTRGPSGCTCTGPGKVLYEGACYDPCPADQTRGPSGCTCTGPGKVLYEGACYDPCPADQTRGPSGCTCTVPGKVLYEGACYDPCPADQTRGPSGCTCTVPGKVLYEGACYDPCPADQQRGPSGCTCTVPGKVLYEGACYDPCPADQQRGPLGCACINTSNFINSSGICATCPDTQPPSGNGITCSCPEGKWRQPNSIATCQTCTSFCKICASATTCTLCIPNYSKTSTGTCRQNGGRILQTSDDSIIDLYSAGPGVLQFGTQGGAGLNFDDASEDFVDVDDLGRRVLEQEKN
jgi:hypothetical protein